MTCGPIPFHMILWLTRLRSPPYSSLAFVSTKVPVSMRQKAGAVDVPKRGTNSSGFTAAK